MAHPVSSSHPLAKNSTAQWSPTEWDASPEYWATFEMVKWMKYIQARCDAIEDTSLGLLGDAPSSQGGVFARLAALEAGAGQSRTENFTSVVPQFTDGTITYPDGVTANHQYDLSIVSGKLRIAANASNTSNNLRRAYGLTSAGIMGDSEVRSTISGSSIGDFSNPSGTFAGDSRFQFGHVHRYTRTRQVLQAPTLVTAASSTTVGVTGTPWTAHQWIGLGQSLREVWVQIVAGTGTGQKRRVIDNGTGLLTVDHAWTVTPATSGGSQSQFEIYTYQVRALSIVIGNVAGGGHNMVQPNIWDGGAFRQPGIGQQNLADASTSSGAYLLPLGSFGTYRAFPWFMKSRVIGNQLQIAVWASGDPETSYADATGRAFSWTLGAGDDYGYAEEPGMSGLYMAHLNAGDYMEFDTMTVTKL